MGGLVQPAGCVPVTGLGGQLTIDGETEHIPGAVRDAKGKVESRWVRLIKMSDGGFTVDAPDDVQVSAIHRSGGVIVRWPSAD